MELQPLHRMPPLILVSSLLLTGIAVAAAPPSNPKIFNAAPHETEDGPPLAKGSTFQPGETVFFSFQVSGLGESPLKQVRLTYRVDAVDPNGVHIVEPVESIFDATLHDEDKRWMPKLRAPIAIPPVAPSGIYKIITSVTDDISHLNTTAETTFEVSGHDVPAATELAIRNLTFHRTDEDTHPLPVAVYRPGDTVFARFDIAGFRYVAGNTIHVYYDVAVLNAAGKQIYAQEHAAEDRSFSFYPKPYVAGQMSLTLQRNMRPGEYTVVLTAHDETGHQRAELRHAFTVE